MVRLSKLFSSIDFLSRPINFSSTTDKSFMLSSMPKSSIKDVPLVLTRFEFMLLLISCIVGSVEKQSIISLILSKGGDKTLDIETLLE